MNVWMGVWSTQLSSFTSNWKEMSTLLHTLKLEANRPINRVKGCRLLYLTNNMTSYNIFRKGSSTSILLTKLLMRIKILEMQLGFLVIVLHVPGTVMISESTDGLSRGVSRQGLQHYVGHEILSNICSAAPLLPVVLTWAQHVLQYVSHYFIMDLSP